MPDVKTNIHEYFGDFPDPQKENCTRHLLLDIFTIVLCGVISGAEGFNDIEPEVHQKTEMKWTRVLQGRDLRGFFPVAVRAYDHVVMRQAGG
jgi:hypothetical protein